MNQSNFTDNQYIFTDSDLESIDQKILFRKWNKKERNFVKIKKEKVLNVNTCSNDIFVERTAVSVKYYNKIGFIKVT